MFEPIDIQIPEELKGVIMSRKADFEKVSTSVVSLNRGELERRIRNFKGRFKLDFAADYLHKLSVDKLRHILLAALISSKPHN